MHDSEAMAAIRDEKIAWVMKLAERLFHRGKDLWDMAPMRMYESNCTVAGVLRGVTKRGPQECCVLRRGEPLGCHGEIRVGCLQF